MGAQGQLVGRPGSDRWLGWPSGDGRPGRLLWRRARGALARGPVYQGPGIEHPAELRTAGWDLAERNSDTSECSQVFCPPSGHGIET